MPKPCICSPPDTHNVYSLCCASYAYPCTPHTPYALYTSYIPHATCAQPANSILHPLYITHPLHLPHVLCILYILSDFCLLPSMYLPYFICSLHSCALYILHIPSLPYVPYLLHLFCVLHLLHMLYLLLCPTSYIFCTSSSAF